MITCSVDGVTYYLRTDIETPVPTWKLNLISDDCELLKEIVARELGVEGRGITGWINDGMNPTPSLYRSTLYFPNRPSAQEARDHLAGNQKLRVQGPTKLVLNRLPLPFQELSTNSVID